MFISSSISFQREQYAILTLPLAYSAPDAMALSRTVVFAVSLVSFFFSFRYVAGDYNTYFPRAHEPSGRKPAIDYDVALLMGPMSVLGSIFGVMVNIVFSDYLVFICMMIVLLFSFYKTLTKGIEIRQKELGTREFGPT